MTVLCMFIDVHYFFECIYKINSFYITVIIIIIKIITTVGVSASKINNATKNI